MDQLKLIALDAEDLAVVSAHLQDAVLKVGDMVYMPRERRFAAVMKRFDWPTALNGATTGGATTSSATTISPGMPELNRRQCALRLERVLKAQVSGLDLTARDTVLALLALRFVRRTHEDPAGTIDLVFSGNAAVRLEVECIEAELKDLGPAWRTRSRPRHPDADQDGDGDPAAAHYDAANGAGDGSPSGRRR